MSTSTKQRKAPQPPKRQVKPTRSSQPVKVKRSQPAKTPKPSKHVVKPAETKKAEEIKEIKEAEIIEETEEVTSEQEQEIQHEAETELGIEAKMKHKKTWHHVLACVGILAAFSVVLGGVIWLNLWRAEEQTSMQQIYYDEALAMLQGCYDDYEAEIPKLKFDADMLDKIEDLVGQIRSDEYRELKTVVAERMPRLRQFVELRERVLAMFDDEELRLETTNEGIQKLTGDLAGLSESYQEPLKEYLDNARKQRETLDGAEEMVAALFQNEKRDQVRSDVTRAEYDQAKAWVDDVVRRDVKGRLSTDLEKVDAVLAEKERVAAEEQRKKAAEIAAAWVNLPVPYHSQTRAQIYNSCEVASLLMALQYKGYLLSTTLAQYAEMVPKSDDPYKGFTHSIYDLEPKTVPHWIAPSALAKFGRDSSGANVVDMTGASLAELRDEVAAGNPVVIYITFNFNPPKAWAEGMPTNFHVVLLTGYNTKTGALRFTDPWTPATGTTRDASFATAEATYNLLGKKAVVVR